MSVLKMPTGCRGPGAVHHRWLVRAIFALLLGFSAGIAAESMTAALANELAGQRKNIEQNSSVGEEQKKLVLAKLDEAAVSLEEAAKLDARHRALAERLQLATSELEKLRSESGQAGVGLSLADIKVWSLTQLEVVLSERQLRLGEMEKELADSERQLSDYLLLARNGSTGITQLQARLGEAKSPSLASLDNASAQTAAERLSTLARRQQLTSRLDWLSLQQNNLSLLVELAQARRDLLAGRVEGLRKHLAAFREYLQKRREEVAMKAQQAAQQARQEAPSSLSSLRNQVAALAVEQTGLVTREAELDRTTEHTKRRIEEITRDRQRLQQIVELGGASAQVSSLLQKRRVFTVAPGELTKQVIGYQEQLSEMALRQIALDQTLRESADPKAALESLLQTLPEGEREGVRAQAGEALNRQAELSLELWKQYTRVITKLSTLDALTRQRLDVIQDYRAFIDDRLLWMPSTEILSVDQTGRLYQAAAWLLSPQNLALLGEDVVNLPRQHGIALLFLLAGLLAMVRLHRWSLQALESTAQAVQKPRSDRFGKTLSALAATLLLALPLPWFFIGSGLLLAGVQGHDYTQMVAAGLQAVGHTLLLLRLLRQLCRKNGVALAHLGWNEMLCQKLETQTSWLSSFAPPLAFLAILGSASVPSAFVHLGSSLTIEVAGLALLGLVALVSLMALLSVSIFSTWRKDGQVMISIAANPESRKWAEYHLIWFYPVLLVIAGLAVSALSGYYYTSAFLAGKIGQTVWFVLLLMFLRDLLLRGLYATQRRLRFEEALRYLESAQQRSEGADPAAPVRETEIPVESGKPDYAELGEKVRQLVKMGYMITVLVGLWLIWHEVIPAMNFMRSIELPLTTSKLVDGISQDVPVTLGDILGGLVLGGLAVFAARNVPALLELTLLQRLPLSRATRYAITTLTRYVVAMLGVAIAFNTLGLQWSSIQWLVAALSVGLGFGLQEIVANFISGIILLFEQPIRVGDVVTVENTTGTVSRIRIRATTITNWDRQELVIPNKSFITGTLINWTLSDTVSRHIITVGVGYDSDTRKAMELMREAALEHPDILDEPAPLISFELFGDNSLNLTMRAYLNDVDKRLATLTDLHQAILDKFRVAGIEISFPQRDVHLDASRPLEFVWRRQAKGEELSS